MLNSNIKKALPVLLVAILFIFTVSSARADSLSKRRASIRNTSSSSSSEKLQTNRNALSQRGYRQTKNSVSGTSSSDSTLKRAFRSVVKVDARGGGFANTVGQMMTRDNSNESRRTGDNWRRAAGYTVNAGNAVRYLANKLNGR
jgi:hypothetical protein